MTMQYDETEDLRRALVPVENARGDDDIDGDTWSTEEMTAAFTVHGFMAPYVTVTRKVDGVKGMLTFRHSPRVYYAFEASE
jgi:hypothetical protein